MEQLTKKKCVPCEGIGRAYTSAEVNSLIWVRSQAGSWLRMVKALNAPLS